VRDKMYNAGSGRHFYASASESNGLNSTTGRADKAETLTYAFGQSSLGEILVAASAKGVAAVLIGDDRNRLTAELKKIFSNAEFTLGDRKFGKTVANVVDLVESPKRSLDLPLDIRGTAFQRCVWKALQAIPFGKTKTYTEVASGIGHPKAVRAVGHACATNPLAILVPCHRVVRTDGNKAGYRWGIDRKRLLIEREAAGGKKSGKLD
jgi:AraC family transcriptional regulator, regulatory protein of adaptative response / methylated-DNA-[protein]-cysteine methyltransferase